MSCYGGLAVRHQLPLILDAAVSPRIRCMRTILCLARGTEVPVMLPPAVMHQLLVILFRNGLLTNTVHKGIYASCSGDSGTAMLPPAVKQCIRVFMCLALETVALARLPPVVKPWP